MFGRKKAPQIPSEFAGKTPVIRSSICTGEKTAGFKDPHTGRFTEVMLLRDERDLREFLSKYGLQESEVKTEY